MGLFYYPSHVLSCDGIHNQSFVESKMHAEEYVSRRKRKRKNIKKQDVKNKKKHSVGTMGQVLQKK